MWGDFILFVAIGFGAQLIDGAIGMAYGLSATTILLGTGVPPAIASASVHAAEIFTTGISGISHWRFGNVRWGMVWRLAIPGMVGGAAGAYLLTEAPGDVIRPFVAGYLLLMGAYILWRATRKRTVVTHPPSWIAPLGLGGGFIDAIGGGGWGPVVNSTLIGHGTAPRYAIGSVNTAEFFVTVVISITFLSTIGFELWPIILGLIVGGALAAPLGAYFARRIPDRPLMILVGAMIMLISLRTLVQTLT
jgi:uncharacterized protein